MASEKVIHLNESTFDNQIQSGVSLVDFWASWCAPCRALAPTIDKLAESYEGQVKITKVDVDQNPGLAARFGVRGIPTVLVFKDGETVDSFVGNDPRQVEQLVERHAN